MEKIKLSYILKLAVTGIILAGVSAVIAMKIAFYLGTITMPDFTGTMLEKALKTSQGMQIDLKVDAEVPSAVYEKGVVVSQNISPNAKIKKGRTVYVNVSAGSKIVSVPDLSNMQKS